MGGEHELSKAGAEAPPSIRAPVQLERDNLRLRKLVDEHTRAASIGAFSLGLLHDINNALACVLGLNALTEDASDEERATLRKGVDHEAWRAARLARDLLTLGRTTADDSPVSPIDIDAHVHRFGKSYAQLLAGTATEFSVHCDSRGAHAKIDPISIGRIVSNLTSNARDALGQLSGGEVVLETRQVDLPPNRAARLRVATGEFVEISVRDSGRGISSHDLARIFEPFYTTKGPEAGVGLGLAVVHDIVRKARGAIDVTSDPGRGTRIDVLLPRCPAPVDATTLEASAIPTADRATARILLIETDSRLRTIWAALLQTRGYRVDAIDARLARLLADCPPDQHSGWDLIIDDDSATDLFEQTKRIRSNRSPDEDQKPTRVEPQLIRPFAPSTLLRAVDDALH